jgi:hypothetical protein
MHNNITDDFIPPSNIPDKKIDNISKIIGTGPDTIKVIKNFMPQKDIDIFVNFGKKNIGAHPEMKHHWVIDGPLIENTEVAPMFKKYTDLMRAKAEELYGLKLNQDRFMDYFIHPEGSYLEPHTDIIDYEQKEVYDVGNLIEKQEDHWPFLWSGHLSIIIYLNNDYDGGILYFPDQKIQIKPEPGMMVMFPGNLHFLHGVTKTIGGPRFTVSLWTRFSDFENKEL